MDQGDKISNERSSRLVRTIGFFTGAPGTDASKSFNDGKPMKTKLNWLLTEGKAIAVWIRNGSDTVYTAGTNLLVVGHVWVKDV